MCNPRLNSKRMCIDFLVLLKTVFTPEINYFTTDINALKYKLLTAIFTQNEPACTNPTTKFMQHLKFIIYVAPDENVLNYKA